MSERRWESGRLIEEESSTTTGVLGADNIAIFKVESGVNVPCTFVKARTNFFSVPFFM